MLSKLFLRFLLVCAVFLIAAPLLMSQQDLNLNDEIISNIGLKLEDLFARYGAPKTVHAVRGDEDWQDDVVFVYNDYDFYIYRDRVWQIGLKSGYGVKLGDSKAAVLRALGDKAQDAGDYMLYPLAGGAWPLSLRINFNSGRVSGIFVYRMDF